MDDSSGDAEEGGGSKLLKVNLVSDDGGSIIAEIYDAESFQMLAPEIDDEPVEEGAGTEAAYLSAVGREGNDWALDKDGEFISPDNRGPAIKKTKGRKVRYPGVVRQWHEAKDLTKRRRRMLLPPCPHDRAGKRKASQASITYLGTRLGSSVGLYFRVLTITSAFFCVITALHLPMLIAAGQAETEVNSFSRGSADILAGSTLGALLPDNWNALGMSRDKVLGLTSGLDALAMLLLLAFSVWGKRSQEKRVEEYDENVLSMSDYTVVVDGLPSEIATPELACEVAEHFENYPVMEGNAKRDVVMVCLGTSCSDLVSLFRRRTEYISLKRRYHALENNTRGEQGHRQRRWAKRRADNVSDAIVREWASIAEEYRVTQAFVTFETADEMSLTLNDYPEHRNSLAQMFIPEMRRFRARGCKILPHHETSSDGRRPAKWGRGYPLGVRRAPEPSNVWWENLELTRRDKCIATVMIGLVVALLVIVSFTLLVGASVLERQLAPQVDRDRSEEEGTLDCLSTFGLDLDRSQLNEADGEALDAIDETKLDPFEGSQCRNYVRLSVFNGECDRTLEQDGVEGLKASGVCRCEATFCYQIFCRNLGFEAFEGGRSLNGEAGDATEYCQDFWTTLSQRASLVAISGVITLIVNMALRTVVSTLAVREKHPTVEHENASIARKISAVQIINMLVLSFVAYGQIPGRSGGILSLGIFFGGKHDDFNQGWYASAGVNLLVIALAQSVGPHLAEIAYSIMYWIQRKRKATKCKLQEELDALYQPRQFNLAERYGQLNSFLFIAVSISAGVPVTSFLVIVYGVVGFVVDRHLLMKDCKPPESGGTWLDRTTWRTLPWAVWLHEGLAMWMFGRASEVDNLITETAGNIEESKAGRRLLSPIGLPHFIIFTLLTIYLFIWPLGKPLRMIGKSFFTMWSGQKQQYSSDMPTFTDAVSRQAMLSRRNSIHAETLSSSQKAVAPWRGPTSYSMIKDSRYNYIFRMKPSDIALSKMRDLEAMLPDLSRHDEEGFTVFDSRERRESALSTEPLSKRLNRLAPGAVEDSRI